MSLPRRLPQKPQKLPQNSSKYLKIPSLSAIFGHKSRSLLKIWVFGPETHFFTEKLTGGDPSETSKSCGWGRFSTKRGNLLKVFFYYDSKGKKSEIQTAQVSPPPYIEDPQNPRKWSFFTKFRLFSLFSDFFHHFRRRSLFSPQKPRWGPMGYFGVIFSPFVTSFWSNFPFLSTFGTPIFTIFDQFSRFLTIFQDFLKGTQFPRMAEVPEIPEESSHLQGFKVPEFENLKTT